MTGKAPTFPNNTAYREAARICRALREGGWIAYLAGGCVRDALLGRPIQDYDIATSAPPSAVEKRFEKTVGKGKSFGVISVFSEGIDYEVATFRTDGRYVDGRRPESVAFGDARGDATRRDFTINGLFFDPESGGILDYVGGLASLDAREIRAIGDPRERFDEDKLRLLRAVRFAAQIGFEIEEETWAALREKAAGIRVVSAERIREELSKLLANPNRRQGIESLRCAGLLEILLPEITALIGVKQGPLAHPEGDVYAHTLLMLDMVSHPAPSALIWAVLLHDIGKPPTASNVEGRIRFYLHPEVGADMADAVLRRLRFAGEERERIVRLVRRHLSLLQARKMSRGKLKRLFEEPDFPLHFELHRLDASASNGVLTDYLFCRRLLEEFRAEPPTPPPLITGHDLIRLGLAPGPRFSEILSWVREEQIEGRLEGHEAAVEAVRRRWPVV